VHEEKYGGVRDLPPKKERGRKELADLPPSLLGPKNKGGKNPRGGGKKVPLLAPEVGVKRGNLRSPSQYKKTRGGGAPSRRKVS